jgi:hypothetical protein
MLDPAAPCRFSDFVHAALAGLCVALSACATAPPRDAVTARPTNGATNEPQGDRYYLGTCATCDSVLGSRGEAVERVIARRDLRFCRESCSEAFERNVDASVRRLDGVMADDQRPHYPITTCIVSGRSLGDAPVEVVLGNRLFRVHSARERAALLADPDRVLRELDEACLNAQSPTYAMPDKCPVQGDILDSDTPIDIVIANRMVRVCCMRCVRVVRARPSQYLAMIDYAHKAARAEHP